MAFDLAQTYRNPVMVAADGFMGQMMEAVEIKPSPQDRRGLLLGPRFHEGAGASGATPPPSSSLPTSGDHNQAPEKFRAIKGGAAL